MSTNPTALNSVHLLDFPTIPAIDHLRANPLAVDALEQHLSKLDDILEQIIPERDRIKHALILHRSPIHRLPIEILTIIFNLATDTQWDIASSDFPWCPLFVCRSWYNTAISTPSLWSSTFLVDGASSVVRTRLPLVLTRSGRQPISFVIANIGSRTMKGEDSPDFTGFKLLSQHVGRWKHASFTRCLNALEWARVSKDHPPVSFTCLETMVISHLHDVERHDFAFFAPIAPRLQKLTIIGGNFDLHLAPFAKELICKRVSLGAQANFLSRSPHNAETFTSAASLPWPSTHSFHHPNLTRVSVNSESFMLLATASIPNLEHLAVTLGLINKQHLNIISRLIQRAEIKLQSLSLTLTRPYEDLDFPDDFASSLATIPTLNELSISFSDEDRYNQWDPTYAVRVLDYLIYRIECYRLQPLKTLRIAYFVDTDRTPFFVDFFVFPVPEHGNLWTRLERFGLTVKLKGGADETEGGMDAEELENLARKLKAKTVQELDSPLLHGVQLDVVYEVVTPSLEELEQIKEAKRLATARSAPDSWRDNIPYLDWYSD